MTHSTTRGGGGNTSYRCPAVRKGARVRLSGKGPECVAYVFVSLGNIIICGLCKRILSEQAQFRLKLNVSLSDLA